MNEHNDSLAITSIDEYLIHSQTIYQNIPDGITIFNAEGYHLWCNDAALDIYGYSSQDEVNGRNTSYFIHPDYRDEEMEILHRAQAGEHIPLQDSTFLVFRKDGTTFPAHVRTTPIYLNGKFVGYQSHTRDVSKLKETEYRLRASLSAIDLLASLVQHDLRNDLHVVQSAIDATLMILDGKDMSTQFLSMAKSGLRRMSNLLTLMTPTISEDSEHLDDLIEERMCQTKEMHQDIKTILLKPVSMKPIKLTERRLLAFVFDNLFRNSVKYAGPTSTIVVKIEQENSTLQIDIVDDGPGIHEKVKSALFQRGATTSGSGLGLYICKRIVEGYSGTITLLDSSTLGSGAAFRITLPFDLPDLL